VERIRVLLVDDQQLIRAGFRMILEAEPDLVVAGEAGGPFFALSGTAAVIGSLMLNGMAMAPIGAGTIFSAPARIS